MRRIAALLTATTVALTLLGALRPVAASAASAATLQGAVTDNYKAVWNADPEIRENRTWLQLQAITVGGVRFTPTHVPAEGTRTYTTDEPVTGSDGSSATVRITAGADVVNKPFRTEGTGGAWGPLLALRDTSTLQAQPVRITLTVVRNDNVLASVAVEYRYDDALYNAPRTSVEYNSPGGRFWTGCTPTRSDWEQAAPAAECPPPPAEEPVDDADAGCTITGTAAADVLTGTAGRDVLCGGGGNDVLRGLGGNDVLLGGDGNDLLEGGADDDVVDGGAGSDRMTFAAAAGGIVVNMTQLPHPAWDGPAPGDANIGWDEVTGVEAATGTRYADQLLGGGTNDRLSGAGGSDTIYGYGGGDLLAGGSGNDRIYGGDGMDSLTGSTGADALNGQAASDRCVTGGQTGDTKTSCER